ncbi:MAG: HK97 family phage prohead protease, partial [Gammaproteobacteria bacterium]
MNRAYALLDVKRVDTEARTIEGIASTPEVDRVGDIVEPAGAQFKLPLPLLWQHGHDSPIGDVIEADVTDAGIRIKAKIAQAGLADYIDRAWTLIKAGLVRGLSIGYRVLDDGAEPLDPKDPWGGLRIEQWELLELSAVTIPANASAGITSVKQLKEIAMSEPAAIVTDPPAKPRGELRTLDAPGIVKASKRPYSFMRALSYAAGNEMVDAGLEREYAQEAQRRQPWRTFKGFAIPLNVVMDRKATHSTSD